MIDRQLKNLIKYIEDDKDFERVKFNFYKLNKPPNQKKYLNELMRYNYKKNLIFRGRIIDIHEVNWLVDIAWYNTCIYSSHTENTISS